MDTITVQAVYRDGVLKPATHLDLPDGATVNVQITPSAASSTTFGSLAGIWSDLAEAEVEQIEQGLADLRQQGGAKIERLTRDLKPRTP